MFSGSELVIRGCVKTLGLAVEKTNGCCIIASINQSADNPRQGLVASSEVPPKSSGHWLSAYRGQILGKMSPTSHRKIRKSEL